MYGNDSLDGSRDFWKGERALYNQERYVCDGCKVKKIMMWEIFSQKTPYYELGAQQKIVKFVYFDNGRPNLDDIKQKVSSEFIDLIKLNWDKDPSKRQEFRELITVLQNMINS
jgi:hypothetical protein